MMALLFVSDIVAVSIGKYLLNNTEQFVDSKMNL